MPGCTRSSYEGEAQAQVEEGERKPETRRPKPERNPKPDFRRGRPALLTGSSFGSRRCQAMVFRVKGLPERRVGWWLRACLKRPGVVRNRLFQARWRVAADRFRGDVSAEITGPADREHARMNAGQSRTGSVRLGPARPGSAQ